MSEDGRKDQIYADIRMYHTYRKTNKILEEEKSITPCQNTKFHNILEVCGKHSAPYLRISVPGRHARQLKRSAKDE